MDLRYGVPPILNLMFLLFFSTQPGPGMWNSNLNISSILVHQFSFLELAFLFLAVMFLLLFLFTSVEVPLILHPIRFRLGAGGWFSGALQSVPTYFITITQNEESSTSAPLQDDVELGLTHGQQNLEHNEETANGLGTGVAPEPRDTQKGVLSVKAAVSKRATLLRERERAIPSRLRNGDIREFKGSLLPSPPTINTTLFEAPSPLQRFSQFRGWLPNKISVSI
ncbi:hypothetical protein QQP08_006050 [Theobroma cacao]|nr:hypothetical protein QQP08_006050 [Theobroma cacao]